MRMRIIGKALVLAMAVGAICALGLAQTAQKPKFEVASIKLNKVPGAPSRTINEGGLIYSNVALSEYKRFVGTLTRQRPEGPAARI